MSTEKKNQELLVIGAGFGRTGTYSLKTALNLLLSGKCYHMEDILEQPAKLPVFWLKAFNRRGRLSAREWDNHLKGYVAAVDMPCAAFYRELMEVYPNAKVILTVRDPDSWVRSIRATILNEQLHFSSLFTFIMKYGPMRHFIEMKNAMFEYSVGPNWLTYTDDQWKEFFIRWNQEVEQHVPKDRLLVFRVQDGWKPLCEFLGLPEPPSNVPFPKVNDTSEFQQRIVSIKKKMYFFFGGVLVAAGSGLVGVAVWAWKKQ